MSWFEDPQSTEIRGEVEMKTRLTSRRGLSLVEVTIMLFVLMLLTGVLAPSIMDFVRDAQWVKVKEDCEAIGVSVARLARDIGPCLKFDGTGPCTKTNRVDVLYSDGPDVTPADMSGDGTVDFYGGAATATELNWHKDDSRGDSMEHQLVDNGGGPNYPSPGDLGNGQAPGPSFGLGWRGAYLSPPIGPDPWGHRYLVNTVFLAMATDAGASSLKTVVMPTPTAWSNDTFCISPGPNGQYETAFGGNATHGVYRRGDDFIYVISGGTR
jgi:hypothetical protein